MAMLFLTASPWYVTLTCIGLMILFMVIEAATTAMVSIWFAGGALVAAILSLLTDNYIAISCVFAVVSAVLFAFFWKRIKRDKSAKTNVDALIGTQVKIIEITADDIKVEQGDKYWLTVFDRQEQFSVGEYVKITGIQGNQLVIKKIEK